MKLFLITILIIANAFLLLSWRMFLHPSYDTPDNTDAIVVFAGGGGERFEKALQLANDGVASTVIVNSGALPWPGRDAILQHCEQPDHPYRLICLLVEEDNTAGEALHFARVARELGLTRLVAVTSDIHLKRASVLLSQCHDGYIARVGSDPIPYGYRTLLDKRLLKALVHEWGGLLFALSVERFRNCPG